MQPVHVTPDPCIACTTCTVFCPVAEATPEFLGPRMIGPAYERFRLLGLVEDPSLTYCSNCKNCDISCPQGVQVAAINMTARARQCSAVHKYFLRDWIVSHSERLGHLISPIPAFLKNYFMRNCVVRSVLDHIGIARKATMPCYAPRRFRSLLPSLNKTGLKKKVALFPGCYIDLYDTETGEDLVWALNNAGYEVITSDDFCCCGVPMVASGFMDDARKNAEHNLAAIKNFLNVGIPVLTACPSCELMFKEEIPTFFPELTGSKGGVFLEDAQEFLLEAADKGDFSPELHVGRETFLYHAPCHLRALGIGLPGFDLMQKLGVPVRSASAGCCGIAGSYGFKKEKYDIAMKVGAQLFTVIRESQAKVVTSECGTCRLQISGVTKLPCLHPVSIIRRLTQG